MKNNDFESYESPYWFVTELCKFQEISGIVFDPCAGKGAISSLLSFHPKVEKVITNDIDKTLEGHSFYLDAANAESWKYFPTLYSRDWIITNPPFSKASEIIENTWKFTKANLAFFLPLSFLEPCEKRQQFLFEHPPSKLLSLPRYCFRKNKLGEKWATDTVTIACFIWHRAHQKQEIKIVPRRLISGFYKNPDKAIYFDEAIEILESIVVIEDRYKDYLCRESYNDLRWENFL